MLLKSELKYYSSLLKKKFRSEERKFLVEGEKLLLEGLNSSYNCEIIFLTHEYSEKDIDIMNKLKSKTRTEILKNTEFKKLTDTVTPQGIAGVFSFKERSGKLSLDFNEKIACFLDNISDPGNVGTILRNCDWFGIKNVFLSANCAELFNPKTIRASMGSVFHLEISEDTDEKTITELKSEGYKIYSADLSGEDVFNCTFDEKIILTFSNEANGPSQFVIDHTDRKITIPKYGKAESLNVASASAVILSRIVN